MARERAEEFYPFIWTADLRQSESVSSSQRFLGLAVLEKTFAAAELVGGIGLVFYSLENICCVIILEWSSIFLVAFSV